MSNDMTRSTTNNPMHEPTPQDMLLNELLDAQAAGDAQAVRVAWSKLDALGPAALASAKRTQQSLHDLRTMRMPVDLTDRVLARFDATEKPQRTVAHAPTSHAATAPRGRRRLPRFSGTMIASLLALATVGGLMLFARPSTTTLSNPSAHAQRPLAPRLVAPTPDQGFPTPGVQDSTTINPQRLTLGDTSRYDQTILTPITSWGTWNAHGSTWAKAATPWWQASAARPGVVAPFLSATAQDQALLTPSQRAGQELMLLLEAQAKQISEPQR